MKNLIITKELKINVSFKKNCLINMKDVVVYMNVIF